MNIRTTIWLLLLALALGTGIYLADRHSSASKPARAAGGLLLPGLQPDAINALELTISNQFVRLEKTNQAWRLLNPPYPAQKTIVESFIRTASQLPQLGYIPPREMVAETGGAAAFGLEPPRATVSFGGGPERVRLEIGARSPIADRIYVRKVGDPGIYLTPAALLEQLPLELDDWRDPALLPLTDLAFDTIQIRAGNRPLELKRAANGAWSITRPIAARADASRALALLGELRSARVIDFVSDSPAADLEPFGLANPDLRASLVLKSNVVATLDFGASLTNSPDLVYARRMGANVVVVPRKLAEMLRLGYKAFHDPQLLALPASQIDRIDVQALQNFSLTRQSQGWFLQTTNKPGGIKADLELVADFMARVSALEIVDFGKEAPTEQDLAALQLNPPLRRYSFYVAGTNGPAGTNTLLAHLDFGSNTVGTISVRRSDEIPVYLTHLGRAQDLPAQPWELRDRALWAFDPTAVTNLTVTVRGVARSVAKDPLTGWSKDDLEREIMTEVIYRLATMKAERWVGKGPAAAARVRIPELDQQISLTLPTPAGPQTHTLRFGDLGVGGRAHAAAALDGEADLTVFTVSADMYREVVSALFAPLSE